MTTNVTTFSGNYSRNGKEFFNSDTNTTFLITERKTTSPNKPPLFLLQILPSGKRLYISSLYPIDNDRTYYFDYKGVKYSLVFDYHRLEVTKQEKDLKSHIPVSL